MKVDNGQTLVVKTPEGMKVGERLVIEQHGMTLDPGLWGVLTDAIKKTLRQCDWLASIHRTPDGRNHQVDIIRIPNENEYRWLIGKLQSAMAILLPGTKVKSFVKKRGWRPKPRTNAEAVEGGIGELVMRIEKGLKPVYANRELRAIVMAQDEHGPFLDLAIATRDVLASRDQI